MSSHVASAVAAAKRFSQGLCVVRAKFEFDFARWNEQAAFGAQPKAAQPKSIRF
jgi:hypothetical protein